MRCADKVSLALHSEGYRETLALERRWQLLAVAGKSSNIAEHCACSDLYFSLPRPICFLIFRGIRR